MRKNIEKIILSFFATLLVISSSLTVSAASSQTGTLAGQRVSGSVSITASQGSAVTSISLAPNSGSSVSISLSYSYIDLRTNTNPVTTVTAGANGNIAASASRSIPNSKDYRSWRARGTHRVTYSGQTWNANTEIFY